MQLHYSCHGTRTQLVAVVLGTHNAVVLEVRFPTDTATRYTTVRHNCLSAHVYRHLNRPRCCGGRKRCERERARVRVCVVCAAASMHAREMPGCAVVLLLQYAGDQATHFPHFLHFPSHTPSRATTRLRNDPHATKMRFSLRAASCAVQQEARVGRVVRRVTRWAWAIVAKPELTVYCSRPTHGRLRETKPRMYGLYRLLKDAGLAAPPCPPFVPSTKSRTTIEQRRLLTLDLFILYVSLVSCKLY